MRRRQLDRLRQIVDDARPHGPTRPRGNRVSTTDDGRLQNAARQLGGVLETGAAGSSILVSRTYRAVERYGGRALGDYPRPSDVGMRALAGQTVTAVDGPDDPGAVFYDLETTGLSGGAGTVAWVVGVGWFEGGGFEAQQYVLTSPTAERQVLSLLTRCLRRFQTLVTFNGRSFDGPLTEMRYAFHRLPSPLVGLQHLDLLHPSRHLWKGDEGRLVNLERDVLGVRRLGDVPGAEIPGRYQAFLRTGEASHLEPVLEHNRLDLVSLAVLTGLASELVRNGVAAAADASQALGLGRVYERVGRLADARDCYRRATQPMMPGPQTKRARRRAGLNRVEVRSTAYARLAGVCRRMGHHREAAEAWTRLLALPNVSLRHRRDATVALAVHHEHRNRDVATAHRFALLALRTRPEGRSREAVEHRLRRLDRKLEVGRSALW